MSNVYIKSSKQYLRSVDTRKYLSDPDAVINPDVTVVWGWPIKYWIESGGTLTLMDQAARDAVDAAEAAAEIAQQRTEEKERFDREKALIALCELIVDENNNLRQALMELKAQLKGAALNAALTYNLPDRTYNQLFTAIKNRVDTK